MHSHLHGFFARPAEGPLGGLSTCCAISCAAPTLPPPAAVTSSLCASCLLATISVLPPSLLKVAPRAPRFVVLLWRSLLPPSAALRRFFPAVVSAAAALSVMHQARFISTPPRLTSMCGTVRQRSPEASSHASPVGPLPPVRAPAPAPAFPPAVATTHLGCPACAPRLNVPFWWSRTPWHQCISRTWVTT
jgi:hypothetical protein